MSQVTGINQTDYMKLFMQELTYQDPLKPIDNREFMAQMAQFSALQQAESGNSFLKNLVALQTESKSLLLLGKTVKVTGSEEFGQVKRISFENDKPPVLKIDMNGGEISKQLEDITEVQ